MKNLKELIKNRIFRIPDYQRGYSWEKKQIIELIDDIDNIRLQSDQSYHFTGIISYSKIDNEKFYQNEGIKSPIEDENIELFHITDGQQRLTTIFIMLFELNKLMYPENFQEKFLDTILTYKHEEKRIYKFGYDVDVPSREHLFNVTFEDENYKVTNPETLYTTNLNDAKKTIKEYFSTLITSDLKRFQRKLENRLLFQEFVIDTTKLDVSMVFETMNYRGKSLSKLELFKNRLIYLLGNSFQSTFEVDTLRKQITDAWLTVYSWLGKKSEVKLNDDAFLTVFTIIYFNNSRTKDSEFKNIIDRLFVTEFPIKSNSNNENFTQESLTNLTESLELLVKCYFLIYNPFSSDDELKELNISNKIKRQLYIINQIGGSNYIKTLICCALASFISSTDKDEDEFLKLLLSIEKHQMLVFNLLGRKMDANRPDIYRMCNDLFTSKTVFSIVENKVRELTHKWWDRNNVIALIQDNLNESSERFYKMNGIKMMLFLKEVDIDSSTSQMKKYNDFRLELIFPIGHGSNVKFKNVVRNRDPKSIDYLRYSLGNIIISERAKIDRGNVISPEYTYNRSQLLSKSSISENNSIALKVDEWSDTDILNRGLDILSFIKERYSLLRFDNVQMRHVLVDNLVIQQSVVQE